MSSAGAAEVERARQREEIRQAAVARDVSAERRDRAADERDSAAERRRAAADSDDAPARIELDRQERADRAASSLDRIHSGRDRDAAATDLANLCDLGRLDRLAVADVQVLADAEQTVITAANELRSDEVDSEPLPPAASAT